MSDLFLCTAQVNELIGICPDYESKMMANEPSFGAKFLLSEFIFILVLMFPSQALLGNNIYLFLVSAEDSVAIKM